MSRVIRRRWINDYTGPSRKDNRGCEYEAYVPDPLVGRAFTIDGEVAAELAPPLLGVLKVGAVPGHENQVARAHAADVVAYRLAG